ncbi:hypothetical protein C8Q76DRAFT_416190 [Earliella scabrosa]|nr:hypothetical protein C8Q76DRAFT_416190 [Earliella scabrosa]
MLAILLAVLAHSLLRIPTAFAQESEAACGKGFEWMMNSLGQSPCLVTSWLSTPCYGLNNNNSDIPAAGPGLVYQGPQGTDPFISTPCDCNTVLYSTLAACAICQGADIDPWPTYQTNCTSVYDGSYPEPIPDGTAIPAWAFLNITRNSNFNVTAAKAFAAQDLPDVTVNPAPPEPVSSSTSASSESTSTITSAPSLASTNLAPASPTSTIPAPSASIGDVSVDAGMKPTSNVVSIVGGTVGGLIGVLLTCALMLFIVLRHRKNIRAAQHSCDSSVAEGSMTEQSVISPTSSKSTGAGMVYDANNPRTFPAPLVSYSSPSANVGAHPGAQPARGGAFVTFYKGYPQV